MDEQAAIRLFATSIFVALVTPICIKIYGISKYEEGKRDAQRLDKEIIQTQKTIIEDLLKKRQEKV